jgi:hypothetical protein
MSNRTFKIYINNDFDSKGATFECQDGEVKPPRKRYKGPGQCGQMTVKKAPDSIKLIVSPVNETTADPNRIEICCSVNCHPQPPIDSTDFWEVNLDYTGENSKNDKENHIILTNEAQTNVTVTDKQPIGSQKGREK